MLFPPKSRWPCGQQKPPVSQVGDGQVTSRIPLQMASLTLPGLARSRHFPRPKRQLQRRFVRVPGRESRQPLFT